MYRVATQRSDELRARFMADVSIYGPSMLVWLDESGCDKCNTIRKYGYSIRGIPMCDQRLLNRGTRYSAISIVSTTGIHLAEGNVDGSKFVKFHSLKGLSLQWFPIFVYLCVQHSLQPSR